MVSTLFEASEQILNVFDESDDPISLYTESHMAGTATQVQAAKIATETVSATGNQVEASSNTKYEEAKSFRYNAAVYWDLYAPQVVINTDQTVLQAKTFNVQAFHQQTSAINFWLRAQNLAVIQSDHHYDYSTDEHFIGAPNFVVHSGAYYTYGDSIKIQAGNQNYQRVSDDVQVERYGDLQLGAVDNIALTADTGGTVVSSNTFTNVYSRDILLEAQNKAVLRSTSGLAIKSLGEVSILSGGSVAMAASSSLRFSTAGALSITASTVQIGLSTSAQAINLDILRLVEDLAESVVSLNVPTDLLSSSASFLQGLPAVSDFTSIAGAVTGFNAFNPSSIMSYVNSLSNAQFDSIVGNVLGGTIANVASSYTGIASALVGSVLPSALSGNSAGGLLFQFDQYPKLKPLDNYLTAPVDSPRPYTAAADAVYAPFPTMNVQ